MLRNALVVIPLRWVEYRDFLHDDLDEAENDESIKSILDQTTISIGIKPQGYLYYIQLILFL